MNLDDPRSLEVRTLDFGEAPAGSFLGELWLFVRATRKWWLVPILAALLLLGFLVLLSASSYAPFIYTLF